MPRAPATPHLPMRPMTWRRLLCVWTSLLEEVGSTACILRRGPPREVRLPSLRGCQAFGRSGLSSLPTARGRRIALLTGPAARPRRFRSTSRNPASEIVQTNQADGISKEMAPVGEVGSCPREPPHPVTIVDTRLWLQRQVSVASGRAGLWPRPPASRPPPAFLRRHLLRRRHRSPDRSARSHLAERKSSAAPLAHPAAALAR